MFNSTRTQTRVTARRGAILVLIAILLPVIALLAAFAVDVAWMQLVNTELRTATDAASRAGAKVLSVAQDQNAARAAALDAASRNLVAGDPMLLAASDVKFGRSEQLTPGARFTFTETNVGVLNAIKVDGRRTQGAPGGPVDLFFARLVGKDFYEPTQTATSTVLDRDICVVIDRSGSMGLDINFPGGGNGQNCGPMASNTRFAALDAAIVVFLQELDLTFPNELVALASYSNRFQTNCSGGNIDLQTADIRQELTQNYSLVRGEMTQFMTNGIGGRTAIGEGLIKGIEAITSPLARPFAVKTIVLMTDGRHNEGVEPAVIAQQAAAQDIVVHTISFSPSADLTRMQDVADATGGQHFHADTAGDLADIFRQIARTLPVLLTE
ncbi:MAG: vWA domain-containing protein [Aeoliella sp.]